MARSKLTDELREKVCDFIRRPLAAEIAAQHAGIAESTHYDWIGRGRREAERIAKGGMPYPYERKYVVYAEAVTRARSDSEAILVTTIKHASEPREVTKTRTETKPVIIGNRALTGDDGRVLTYEHTITERWIEFDWRAALELLKRRFPERWSEKVRAELTGPGGGPIEMKLPVQKADLGTLREVGAAMVECGLLDQGQLDLMFLGSQEASDVERS